MNETITVLAQIELFSGENKRQTGFVTVGNGARLTGKVDANYINIEDGIS